MNNKTKKIIIWTVVIIALAASAYYFIKEASKPGKYDDFAVCLNNKGAVFYGTFWCPYCQKQKAMFGKSANLLPYEECSTPDGKGRLSICDEKKIEGYPTWIFADESRETGVVSFARLAEKTSCALPQ
ncbi:hypothetical protein A3I27_01540 [Candidatus Giovannonibacteria bacterium RIFCSPLOWO2_02_FULL_43_11b]|nr:MAG: hypothetical protein A3I27_01540 [Candidatus Giovannonibacteria bacterium RIFCSPLOWO2_02_FULL_43_11b]OGF92385.1 MAG: hypothetical protein A3H04_01490 [Candidatus Giovannonibacteria bacterium RIFCSPLOWO2_12_FULL_43_11c]